MILSHRHRFIFIKTEKTAGTSVELALARVCGPGDIITPVVHPADRQLRDSLGPGYRREQNYHIPWEYLTPLDLARAAKTLQRPQFYNHIGAADIRRFVAPDVWNTYYKFCVERNPWDKAISLYYWWRELEEQYGNDPRGFRTTMGHAASGVIWMIERHPVGGMSLSEFIQTGRANLIQGFNLYTIDGEIVVDRVIQFDRLQAEISEAASHLGLDDLPPLPRAKAGVRKAGTSPRELLTQADRDKIARVFAREIAHFSYQY